MGEDTSQLQDWRESLLSSFRDRPEHVSGDKPFPGAPPASPEGHWCEFIEPFLGVLAQERRQRVF